MTLSHDEITRYSQQLKLTKIGLRGQLKLKNARVLCVGAGGLGCPLLLYLAAAGVGTIGILDHDRIELSNLSRQILYQQAHIGQQKALLAKQQLLALNPSLTIQAYPEQLTLQNAEALLQQYDFIADCSDNFPTRYLLNEIAYSLHKPSVSASIAGFVGQCSIYLGSASPCLRCLFPLLPTDNAMSPCNAGGVLGVVPGILGLIQATEIIKWIIDLADPLSENFLTVDILTLQIRKFRFSKNADCPVCGERSSQNRNRSRPKGRE